MTDEAPICPRCGATVSRFTHYIFVPSDNKYWHAQCWKAEKNKQSDAEVVG